MKFIKKILPFFVLVLFGLSCFLWVIPPLLNVEATKQSQTPIILTLWHVDSFEGGVGSRADWLKKRALEFEKTHKGVYIDVVKLTYEQLIEKLQQKRPFDLASFGVGVGYELLNRLAKIDGEFEIYNNLDQSGKIDGVRYGVPYLSGGYILASRKEDLQKFPNFDNLQSSLFDLSRQYKLGKKTVELKSVVVGSSDFCIPLLSLTNLVSRPVDKVVALSKDLTQYACYERFLYNDTATVLLGSQRDYWRLSNRQKNGKIGNVEYDALLNYTDLTQYVGVGETGEYDRQNASLEFVKYLVSKKAQSKLTDIGMLPIYDYKIYSSIKVMASLESGLSGVKCLNAFTSKVVLNEIYNECLKVIQTGNAQTLKKYL